MNNDATTTGGAISISRSNVLLNGNVFRGNRATYGAVIASLLPNITASDTIINQNYAYNTGGAIL